jgi:hypothetical protein
MEMGSMVKCMCTARGMGIGMGKGVWRSTLSNRGMVHGYGHG